MLNTYEKHAERLRELFVSDPQQGAAIDAAITLMRTAGKLDTDWAIALNAVATFLRRSGSSSHAKIVDNVATFLCDFGG